MPHNSDVIAQKGNIILIIAHYVLSMKAEAMYNKFYDAKNKNKKVDYWKDPFSLDNPLCAGSSLPLDSTYENFY